MKNVFKYNNFLLFLLAAAMPFLDTFSRGGHSFGNFQQLSFFLVLYYLTLVKNTSLNYNKYKFLTSDITKNLTWFYLGTFVSMFFVEDMNLGIQGVFYNLQFLIIFYILSFITFYTDAVKSIYNGLLLGFALSVFIAIMQSLGVQAFNLFSESELNQNTTFSSNSDTSVADILRIWGPFGNSLTFSEYLSVAGIVLFYYFKTYHKNKIIAWIVFGTTLFAIGLTVSRMAFLAFLGSYVIIEMIMANRRQRIIYLLIFAGSLILVSFLLNSLSDSFPIISRLTQSQDDFKNGRLGLWLTGVKVFFDMPFFGAGPGELNIQLYRHGWVFETSEALHILGGHVENYYLTVLITYGIIPFIFYIKFTINYFKASFKIFMAGLKDVDYTIAAPVLSGFISLAINNLVNPILISDQRIQMMLMLMLVIVNAYYKNFIGQTRDKTLLAISA